MTAPRYTANEAARLTGAPVETIRTWAKRGLIGRPDCADLHPAYITEIAVRRHLACLGIEGVHATPLAIVADDPVGVAYLSRFANGDHAVTFERPECAVVVIEVDLAAIRADIAARWQKEAPNAE